MRLILVLMFLILPFKLMASSLPEFPFVGVDGVAEIEVAPDTATITFRVVAFSEKEDEALKTVNSRTSDLFDIAKEHGINKNSIISMGIDVQIKRQVNRESGYNQTNILGYEVTQVFKVELDDLSKYSSFSDKLISLGNVAGINAVFDVKNRKQILRSLVAEAGKDAKQKAQDLAAAMEVKLGSVFALTESKSFNSFFANFGLDGQLGAVSASIAYDRSANMMVPKSIAIKKNISVIYKLK